MKKTVKTLWIILTIVYAAVLFFLLFWRGRGGVLSGASFSEYLTAMSNFVPFATIRRYLASLRNHSVSSIIPIRNLVGNFILFMPFALIMHHFTKMKTAKLLVCTFGLLLAVEILQISTRTGSFDVDDIILNLLGAGLAYRIISRIDVKPREV